MLKLADIVVGHGSEALLSGLSLSFAAGQPTVLQGRSGLGKSTLLRACAGLSDPLAGRIELEGETAEQIGYPCYRRRVCYLAQQPVLLESTVAENLALPFSYATATRSFPEDEAVALLAELGLRGRFEGSARKLSVGEQQRVALVRLLLLAPDVMLLDEPTSALDPESTQMVEVLLRRYGRSCAIVLVSHDPAQVARLKADVVDLGDYAVARSSAARSSARDDG